MCQRVDPVTQDEVLAPQDWIKNIVPLVLLNLLRIPHFRRSPKLNIVVKVLLSCIHDGYLWLDHKIDLNVDVIQWIIVLSKVGTNPSSHVVGKSLDKKVVAKLMKEFNFSKGGRAYDAIDIQDEALRFTI